MGLWMLVDAGHSESDSFISKAHSQKLHKAYAGDKNLIMFDGDHNSHRPQFFYASALIFLNTVLQIDRHMAPAEAAATAADQDGCACTTAQLSAWTHFLFLDLCLLLSDDPAFNTIALGPERCCNSG